MEEDGSCFLLGKGQLTVAGRKFTTEPGKTKFRVRRMVDIIGSVGEITALAASRDASLIATGTPGSASVFRRDTREQIFTIAAGNQFAAVNAVRISDDNQYLALAYGPNGLKVANLENKKIIYDGTGSAPLRFSRDSKFLWMKPFYANPVVLNLETGSPTGQVIHEADLQGMVTDRPDGLWRLPPGSSQQRELKSFTIYGPEPTDVYRVISYWGSGLESPCPALCDSDIVFCARSGKVVEIELIPVSENLPLKFPPINTNPPAVTGDSTQPSHLQTVSGRANDTLLTGIWHGTWIDKEGRGSGIEYVFDLIQEGNNITGTWKSLIKKLKREYQAGTVTGERNGANLKLNLSHTDGKCSGYSNLIGTVADTILTGTVSAGNSCNDYTNSGTFNFEKQ